MDLVDVIEGSGPAPLLVLSLIEGLIYEPQSMFRAEASGGREFLGWDETRNLLASLYDAINTNTTATGQWKKGKAPNIPVWPRPGTPERDAKTGKKKATVKDLYSMFARG